MSDIGKTINQAVENLERAGTMSTVWSVMEGVAAQFGFDRVLVLKRSDNTAQDPRPTVLHEEAVPDRKGIIDRGEQWRELCTILLATPCSKPLSVDEFSQLPAGRAFLKPLLAHGAEDGLIVPIGRPDELAGVIVLAGAEPDISPLARSAIHVLAHCAFVRAVTLEKEPKRKEIGALSPREVECLSWAAAGKTDNEIGKILKISPRTARFHIENAKKKLGVSTRIQAVAEALRLKAIAA